MIKQNSRLQGYTIVELMIAMTLGLILAAGIIQVFLGNRQAQRMEQTLARMQENGRIAIDIVTQDLRNAGFAGCASATKVNGVITSPVNAKVTATNVPVVINANFPQFQSNAVRGFSKSAGGVWNTALPADIAGNVAAARANSDVISIFYGVDFGARIRGDVALADPVTLTRPNLASKCFTQNEIVVISSCTATDTFKVTNVPNCAGLDVTLDHAAAGNSSTLLGGQYSDKNPDNPAQQLPMNSAARPRVMTFNQVAYFVGNSGRTNPGGQTVWSLFKFDGVNTQELIEGVEFLRIEYGLLLANGNTRYLTASQLNANDWPQVVSVRLGLLMQSYDEVRATDDSGGYTLAGQPITAAEIAADGSRTLRQAYNATVQLRNR